MSLCSHTIRAISRSRGSLLPFLYQTATIQQPAARPSTRRNISSRSPAQPRHDIPFEDADGNLPPTVEEVQASRKTTITDTERAAFEKLYKTFNAQGQGRRNEDGEHEELDQIADEYYEDEDEGSSKSLDKVFEEALQGTARPPRDRRGLTSRTQPTESPEAGKEASATAPETPAQKKRRAAKAEKDRIKKLRLEERERVDNLLKTAQTDRELWTILNREVLDSLRKLNLDAPVPPPKNHKKERSTGSRNTRNKKPAPSPASVNTDILFPNYPHFLVAAVMSLRAHFPSSPLPLAILPTIKAIGRSSYALGATTQLYHQLLRTAWLQQSSYELIDSLMSDMEANIIEFDPSILEVLDGVVREHEAARQGKLGTEIEMLAGLETWVDGIEKVRKWRAIVAEKLGVLVLAEVGRERVKRVRQGPRFEGTKFEERRDEKEREEVYAPSKDEGYTPTVEDEGYTPTVEPVQGTGAMRSVRADAIPFVGEEGEVLEDVEVEREEERKNVYVEEDNDADARGEWAQEQEQRDADDEDRPAKVML